MDYLSALADAVERDPRLRGELDYRPNSSLYQVGDRLLFAEELRGQAGISYRLVAVDTTPYLMQTLTRARDGARLGALAAALVSDDITRADADVGDLGTERGRRVLRVTRGDGDRRSLPLPGPAAVRIDAYLARRADLAGAKGRPGRIEPGHGADVLFATGTGRRLFAADVWRVMRRLAARAGLPDDLTGRVGPEAMRHSFATLYLDAGGSLSELQEVMGHADPRTTRRYDRERQARRQSPGDLVAAYLSTPPRPRM
jgi:integrase/recombinase XerD